MGCVLDKDIVSNETISSTTPTKTRLLTPDVIGTRLATPLKSRDKGGGAQARSEGGKGRPHLHHWIRRILNRQSTLGGRAWDIVFI